MMTLFLAALASVLFGSYSQTNQPVVLAGAIFCTFAFFKALKEEE